MKKLNFLLLLVLLVFVSCASTPKGGIFDGRDELSMLPDGAGVYLWADVVKGRPLVEVLSIVENSIGGEYSKQILDSTHTAAVGFFPKGQGRRFFLAAAGDFPLTKANTSLSLSKDWKKKKSSGGVNYWFSKKDNMALALGSHMALVSDADPFDSSKNAVPPKEFTEFRQDMALAGWVPNPMEPVNKFLSSMGIPLQIPAELFLFGAGWAAEKDESGKEAWELVLKIKTPSVSQARSLLSVFNVARFFVQRGAGSQGIFSGVSPLQAAALLFANTPEQDAEYLTIRTDGLNKKQIALLFDMFSVYSN